MTAVLVPRARVALSTSSVYPLECAAAFELAERLGYDGVEVMVWTDPVSQEAGALKALSDLHSMPVVSIHAPTLLLTQRVWGPEPWPKVDNSIELATDLGADTVVLHPPFRWQKDYARAFADGVAFREHDTGIKLAVENMFPWRARNRSVEAYLPHWDPVDQPYDHVTLDLSHTATAGSDAMAMAAALGPRLAHIHLADGMGSPDMGLDVMVRHIDYLVDKLGEDHVGLGSDFDGCTVPDPIKDVTGVPKLFEALAARGYDAQLIAKLARNNWLACLDRCLRG